ncbi:hypothetical protein [Cronobacter turicensis]|uniref:hypothetical protein n=1 Tax=Cronobacter turicensis TaxID=413502 RepID=UPI0024C2A10B|nr:hypothetical protein [Cronobacter turicensis]MDK1229375.1 hypothetical protein [Cronobacter turicensis]
MKNNKIFFMMLFAFFSKANEIHPPQFSDFPVKISVGPFEKKLKPNDIYRTGSDRWRSSMQQQLLKPVNYAGHYRIYISKPGEFLKDCGDDGWVCGWVIDKKTGYIVSTLPMFNGNFKYYSTIDNGTPSPDDFAAVFYPNSTMLLIYGATKPLDGRGGIKCQNILYYIKESDFMKLFASECDIDKGGV